MLDQIKDVLRNELGLPPGLIFVISGLAAHLLSNALFRKPLLSAWGLLGPLTLGICLESIEIWQQYRNPGLLAPDNDPVSIILMRHGMDVLLMLAAPAVLVILGIVVKR